MRKTIAIVEAGEGADTKGDGSAGVTGITETMGGISGTFEEGCGVGGVVSGDAALHEARIIIDMDRVRKCTGKRATEHLLEALRSTLLWGARGSKLSFSTRPYLLKFQPFTSVSTAADPLCPILPR